MRERTRNCPVQSLNLADAHNATNDRITYPASSNNRAMVVLLRVLSLILFLSFIFTRFPFLPALSFPDILNVNGLTWREVQIFVNLNEFDFEV